LDCFVDKIDLNLFGKYCHNLKDIEFTPFGLNAQELDEFGHTFGHLFKKVSLKSYFNFKKIIPKFLCHCKNLEELVSDDFAEFNQDHSLILPKLQTIINYNIHSNELQEFERFCNNYQNSVQKISFWIGYDLTGSQTNECFANISKLKSLRELSIFMDMNSGDNYNTDSFNQYINQLAINSRQLKILRIILCPENFKSLFNLFYSFENFNNLVKFELIFDGNDDQKLLYGSVKCLKNAKNLKYFLIRNELIIEDFFTDIDIYLPNLCELSIECETEFSDQTLHCVSRLKKLRKFYFQKFNKNYKQITDKGICQLINSCSKIGLIWFGSRPNITVKMIECLIECANKYPKRDFLFYSGFANDGNESEFPAIDMTAFVHKIPVNLTLNIQEFENLCMADLLNL